MAQQNTTEQATVKTDADQPKARVIKIATKDKDGKVTRHEYTVTAQTKIMTHKFNRPGKDAFTGEAIASPIKDADGNVTTPGDEIVYTPKASGGLGKPVLAKHLNDSQRRTIKRVMELAAKAEGDTKTGNGKRNGKAAKPEPQVGEVRLNNSDLTRFKAIVIGFGESVTDLKSGKINLPAHEKALRSYVSRLTRLINEMFPGKELDDVAEGFFALMNLGLSESLVAAQDEQPSRKDNKAAAAKRASKAETAA